MPSVAGGSTEQQRRELHRRSDLSITDKAEEVEQRFLRQIVPLILAPSESPTVSTGG